MQPENGILIKTWIGDEKDTALMELSTLLTKIAKSKNEDIRIALQKSRIILEEHKEFKDIEFNLDTT